jgi:hypothetical protein
MVITRFELETFDRFLSDLLQKLCVWRPCNLCSVTFGMHSILCTNCCSYGTHCTGGWVGPKAGLDVCEKSHTHRGVFFLSSYLVLHCSGIGLSIVVCVVPYCMLWIFPSGKIRRLRSGANPRSWVPEARMQTPRPPKPLFDPRTVQPVASRYTD